MDPFRFNCSLHYSNSLTRSYGFRQSGIIAIHGCIIVPQYKRCFVLSLSRHSQSKRPSGKKMNDPAFCLNGFWNWKHATDSFNHHQASKAHHQAVTVNALEQTPISDLLAYSLLWLYQSTAPKLIFNFVWQHNCEGNWHNNQVSSSSSVFNYNGWYSGYTGQRAGFCMLKICGEMPYSTGNVCWIIWDVKNNRWANGHGSTWCSPKTTSSYLRVARWDLVYDGAANMSGRFSGAQAVIKKKQPQALYVYCGAHWINLLTQSACSASPLLQDALQWVHELGTLSNQSRKYNHYQRGIPEL